MGINDKDIPDGGGDNDDSLDDDDDNEHRWQWR